MDALQNRTTVVRLANPVKRTPNKSTRLVVIIKNEFRFIPTEITSENVTECPRPVCCPVNENAKKSYIYFCASDDNLDFVDGGVTTEYDSGPIEP